MEILVVGFRRDVGKTTVARGLTDYLGASAFKPFAASHVWRYWSVLAPELPERVVSRDASLLADLTGDDVYDVGPVHRLWFPRSHERGGDDVFGLDRVWTGEGQVAVVNSSMDFEGELEEFVDGCDRVEEVDGLDDEIFTDLHLDAVGDHYGERRASGDLVIESYTDVALPFPKLEPDLVLGVEPFRIHRFDGDSFVRACSFLEGRYVGLGRSEVQVEDVLEIEEPDESCRLPPLQEFDRETIEENYFPVFDELL